jgi:uncharacterized protein YoxC
MDPGLVAIIVALLTAPIASLLTWIFNQRKDKASILNVISEAGQTAVLTVRDALETVNHQLEEVRRENQELHNDICELKKQNEYLITENAALHKDLQGLKRQNEQLMQQVHDMRVAYEQNNQQ